MDCEYVLGAKLLLKDRCLTMLPVVNMSCSCAWSVTSQAGSAAYEAATIRRRVILWNGVLAAAVVPQSAASVAHAQALSMLSSQRTQQQYDQYAGEGYQARGC